MKHDRSVNRHLFIHTFSLLLQLLLPTQIEKKKDNHLTIEEQIDRERRCQVREIRGRRRFIMSLKTFFFPPFSIYLEDFSRACARRVSIG